MKVLTITLNAFLVIFLANNMPAIDTHDLKMKEIETSILNDRETLEPFIEFYSIDGLNPNSNLITLIVNEQTKKQWEGVKSKLLKVIHGNNKRSADAITVYSCGLLCFEQAKIESILDGIGEIENKYSSSKSILDVNIMDPFCPIRMDKNKQLFISNILYKTRKYPLSHETLSNDKSTERYVSHLEEYAFLTIDIADFFIYLNLQNSGKKKEAMQAIGKIISRHTLVKMRDTKIHDKKVAVEPYGVKLWGIMRPEIIANIYMIHELRSLGKTDNAISSLQNLVDAISDDGFYWQLNKMLGDLYLDNSQNSQAQKQYRIALVGCIERMKVETSFLILSRTGKARKNIPLPASWSNDLMELKRKIIETGGKIEIDDSELIKLQKDYAENEEIAGNPFDKESLKNELKSIHNIQKVASEPYARIIALNDIEKKIIKADKKELPELQKFYFTGLVNLAKDESDTKTRTAMLDIARSLIKYKQPESSLSKEKLEELKKQVDKSVEEMLKAYSDNKKNGLSNVSDKISEFPKESFSFVLNHIHDEKLSVEARRELIEAISRSKSFDMLIPLLEIIQNSSESGILRTSVRQVERIIDESSIDVNGYISSNEKKSYQK